MFLLDRFFDGTFLTFGIEVMSFADRDQEDRIDPMVYIFPRMTKCTFHKFGTSGEIEKHDALCILPLNIFNEKIYIFLWFWMLVLGALTFLVVVYRVLICLFQSFRAYLLKIRYRRIKGECIATVAVFIGFADPSVPKRATCTLSVRRNLWKHWVTPTGGCDKRRCECWSTVKPTTSCRG